MKTTFSRLAVAFTCTIALATHNCPESLGRASSELFAEAYERLDETPNISDTDIRKTADSAAANKEWSTAVAAYLVVASHALKNDSFERARPCFDLAFALAVHLSNEDQELLLRKLSLIISSSRNSGDYKYFAQKRLQLMDQQKTVDWDKKYYQVQSVALACSQHKKFDEAEKLLLSTLSDLEKISPRPKTYGDCEAATARVYGEAGNVPEATKYYQRALKSLRGSGQNNSYEHALHGFLWFLLNNKMFKEAIPIADEYYSYVTAPAYARWRDRVSFGMIAEKFAADNVEEADKFYRAAFENSVEGTKTAMNMGYGSICVRWAAALDKFGKTDKALAVLKEGMDFCRTVTSWPDAFERNMPDMVKAYANYLRKQGKNSEAESFLNAYQVELSSRKEKIAADHSKWLADASKDPSKAPKDRIKAFIELAYKSFDAHSCDDGLKNLKEAVRLYEENSSSKDNAVLYSNFKDISDHLQKCSMKEQAQPILRRIVRARLVAGFSDPFHTNYGCTLGVGHIPVDPLQDWFNVSGREEVLDELLKEAKASNRPETVVYLLNCQNSIGVDEAALAKMEEIDEWRKKENNPTVLASSLLHTADWCIALGHFDRANLKWKEAVALMTADGKLKGLNAHSLINLSNMFAQKGQLQSAADVAMAGSEIAARQGQPYVIECTGDSVNAVAQKYAENGDTASGEALLKKALAAATNEQGHDSFEERMWLIKLVNYNAVATKNAEAKQYLKTLLESLNRPGMTVAKETEKQLKACAVQLRKNGLESEAKKIDDKLMHLEMQSCVPNGKSK